MSTFWKLLYRYFMILHQVEASSQLGNKIRFRPLFFRCFCVRDTTLSKFFANAHANSSSFPQELKAQGPWVL